ncbi:MAG: bifunctional riboflavin kinase/FAD synthetase [Sphingomonadales bacterium]|nr:bifunctional riboflavin kinase/FAD synthetase [Sphingomonadales bacterium]
MKVHFDVENLPDFTRAVITIGTFDGVHCGHRQVLSELTTTAKEVGGESVIVTFHPHPRKVVSSAILGIRLINTLEERLKLFATLSVDHVVVVPFTDAFANLTAEQYIADFLVQKFKPHTIITGYDHQFGRDRSGNFELLQQMATTFSYHVEEIPKHVLESISISSTRIREALLHSEIEKANRLLGYPFFFSGTVVHGNKIGRTIGYPTANLRVEDSEKIVPGNGIYAVYAQPQYYDSPLKGMMSIGFRPTVDGKNRVVEVNLFGFDEDIYDQTLTVHVKRYLRSEKKFENLQALIMQLHLDKANSLQLL